MAGIQQHLSGRRCRWTFKTGAAPDIIAPTVTNKIPAVGAVNIAPNASMFVAFSEDMDPLTINSNTILVQGSGVAQ
ncbi:MAG: Ig-like domain-containing protein [Moraxellaceae bacterium]|nr:Ig-like domain-containing protein [Moraxellaceae bacterium]